MLVDRHRRPRDPRLLVLEDGQPRRPGRLPRRPGRADRDARQARHRALHLAEHARRVDRARALPLGSARAQHRVRQRRPARAPRRAGRGAWPSRSPRPSSSSPRAATSSGSTSADDVDTRRRCSRPPRSDGRRRSSPAPTSCSRAASRACGSRSRACPPSAIAEGVGRLAGALESARAATPPERELAACNGSLQR